MKRVEAGKWGSGRIVRFKASDGIRLNGMLFGDAHAKSCIIFVHGMGSSLFTNSSLALSARQPSGFAFFTFNNRGHDQVSSFSRVSGKRKIRLKAGTNFERFEDSVHDIRGAIDAMRRLGFRSFVLCGHSTGCQKITYYKYRTGDRRVRALVLLGAADDYAIFRKELGRDFGRVGRLCRRMMASGKGNAVASDRIGFSAQRLNSVTDLKRAEARIFGYGEPLKEFGSLRIPILAVFGSREEYAFMPVRKYLGILESKTPSMGFEGRIIGGANHSFDGHEAELANCVNSWIERIMRSRLDKPYKH